MRQKYYIVWYLRVPEASKNSNLAVRVVQRLPPSHVLLVVRSLQAVQVSEALSCRRL
jgi:hypothetical protein